MPSIIKREKLVVILGLLTFLLFTLQPLLLDLIVPSRSIGQIIGDSAKELVDSIKEDRAFSIQSKRANWSKILTSISFILFAITSFLALQSFQKNGSKVYPIGGAALALIGITAYFMNLSIGLLGLLCIVFVLLLILSAGG